MHTRHDGGNTSDPDAPSLRNRVNLDSSDHTTFFHRSNLNVPYSQLNPFFHLSLLISGFLQATQLFSASLFSCFHVVCGNAHTFTIKHSPEFYCGLSDCRPLSCGILVQTHYFLEDEGPSMCFQLWIMHWIVLCPVLFPSETIAVLSVWSYQSFTPFQTH